MSDLYELLAPHLSEGPGSDQYVPIATDLPSSQYLSRLSTLSLADLTSSEPASLLHATQTHQRSLQALSKRSHKAVIAAASHLQPLQTILPTLEGKTEELGIALPDLESATSRFAEKYDRNADNSVLDRRKKALLLSRNTDRIYDMLDLPNLLSSSVVVAQKTGSGVGSTGTSVASSFASALDIHSQIKRLHGLYPHSVIINKLMHDAELEVANMTSVLVTTLQSPSLKLATAMRTIGLLRRIAPEFAGTNARKSGLAGNKGLSTVETKTDDSALGAMFLVCRLRTLKETLDALEPLRELADQERPGLTPKARNSASVGSLSERYLKRYVEIFREQCFNVVSMYKSIFPDDLPQVALQINGAGLESRRKALPMTPSPLSSFSLHLVDMLTLVLREYLPNIVETQTRESLLTQVLYCAASLGRLGADFSLILASLDDIPARDEAEEIEWVQIMNKHRVQTARLEILARGVGNTQRRTSDSAADFDTKHS